MTVKEDLCKAFCDDLSVRSVPIGLAVSTPFNGFNGEPIGFYIVRDGDELSHLEDDGTTIPLLEASGVEMQDGTRAAAFGELLAEYGAIYDSDATVLRTPSTIASTAVPDAARRFVALLLRLQDFLLLTPERVASTFKEDATRQIKARLIGHGVAISENEPVNTDLADFTPDIVMRAPGRDPVALFFGVSDNRVSEAIMMQMSAVHETHTPLSVIALLEREHALTGKTRRRANNRLAAVPYFREDEEASVQRIAREVLGQSGLTAGTTH